VVKAVKPGFITEAVDHMLDDFVSRLEPFWADAQAKNEPVGALMSARGGQVADALLAISDERAGRSKNATLKKAYEKLRPTGKKHVEAAVPRVGRLVAKFASAAATVGSASAACAVTRASGGRRHGNLVRARSVSPWPRR
jgi:hypothetical protein